jgi:tryptophanyl-tRNA synthetase
MSTEEKKDITNEEQQENQEDVVTAYEIKASSNKGIDYDKLVDKFGCSHITPELIKKIEDVTGQ